MLLISASVLVRGQQLTSSAHRGIAQVPIGEEVYTYLRHLSVKGLINGFSEAELPITEYDVVQFLKQPDVLKLSTAERDLRTKFLRTYEREPYEAVTMFPADSALPLFFSGIPTDEDKYLYRWRDDSTISDFQVHGIASLDFRDKNKPSSGHAELAQIGGRFTGTLSGHVGFFLQATNGTSFGDTTIVLEDPVISRNKTYNLFGGRQYYDFTTAELTYNNDWFTAKLAREAIAYGGSFEGDNVIVSPTVQTPDFLSLGAHVGVVRYHAVFASLLGDPRYSLHPDSTPNPAWWIGSFVDSKYLTLHDLTFSIGRNLEWGFTDMVIFSRRFDLAYLNPFSFLKSVNNSLLDRDKSHLATHARWRIADGIELRGEGLVDDVIFSKIGTGYWSNKWAWQIGGMWSGAFGIPDLDLTFEHTRVEPYTYTSANPQNSSSTGGEIIGTAIGPNSMSFWGMVRWAPSSKLTLEATGFLVEHGENIYDSTGKLIYNAGGDFELSVTNDADGNRRYTILNGRRVNMLTLQGTVRYELWRGLSLSVSALNRSVDYPAGTPPNPIEKPYGQVSIGAKALF
ncbi:MAG TPA: hypothetical protein VEW28_08020 [Candidatus Kapabacteria bacterium]|nr:hypothetical protein [Candidatus Kapabacteria bacterium]